ncbi:hypothetical protein J31TS6_40240 [Brevibacillus reuszeri]|uniref:PIN-like domain-containing protein n=1 Tax=Brevibacillus reuszeri TaxID=54915 RepID=UPI001B113566|nr:PIN-like domain-containing protein [Brevibacillus reuszeri]GIO07996.1 hypothetical protein J31TS6_40240 [Brevibacillus reuszeri]
MRKSFPGYYKPSEVELKEAWKDCLIVLDANVLLNLYRYTDSTRETLLKVIKIHADKIWIPHQVAFEFHFNRISVIDQQFQAYAQVSEIIAAIPNKLASELGQYSKHPTINIKEIITAISEITDKISNKMINQSEGHPNFLKNDSLGETLSNILSEKVGEPFDQEKLEEIYKEGAVRYERKIPPGFKDNTKKEIKFFRDQVIESKFGDLIVWKQLIQKAKEVKKPIILVTDDTKEDWWQKLRGMTFGPRPELVDEIMVATGNKFYMYQTDKFMQAAEKQLDEGSSQAIEEVRAMREFDLNNEKELIAKQKYMDSVHKFLEGFQEPIESTEASYGRGLRIEADQGESIAEAVEKYDTLKQIDVKIARLLNLISRMNDSLTENVEEADRRNVSNLIAKANNELERLRRQRQTLREQLTFL